MAGYQLLATGNSNNISGHPASTTPRSQPPITRGLATEHWLPMAGDEGNEGWRRLEPLPPVLATEDRWNAVGMQVFKYKEPNI